MFLVLPGILPPLHPVYLSCEQLPFLEIHPRAIPRTIHRHLPRTAGLQTRPA